MKINPSDIIVNCALIVSSYAFVFFISIYAVLDYNAYLHENYSVIVRLAVFVLSIFATFYMLALPMFGYFRKGDAVAFFRSGDVKYSWGFGSSMVWLLLLMNMFLLPMIAYLAFGIPVISFSVLYLLSALFGFSLGIETKFEHEAVRVSASLEKELRSYFDDSISGYLPYILLACCVLFPVEYYFMDHEFEIYIKLFVVLPMLVPLYAAARFLGNRLFSLVDLKKQRPAYTRYALVIIPVIAICLFQSWELFLSTNRMLTAMERSAVFMAILFTGILPIRLLYIYEPGVHIVNRLITMACLVVYFLAKSTN